MTAAHDKPEWAQSKREKANAQRVAEGKKPRRRIMPWIVLAVIVIGGVVFFVTRPPAPVAEVASTEPVARQLLSSEIAEIQPTLLQQSARVTGTLVPAKLSAVASQASGRVLSVAVRPGDAVKAGDVLAEIDRATLELQLNQQRATADATSAQLVSSEQALERTEQLASQGLASPSTLEQARSATAALRANLVALESGVQTAEIALSNASVPAPFDGIISERSVEPGQTINAGTTLFTVVNLEEMEFQAAASVNSSAMVAPGQTVTVSVTGLEGRTFEGTVTRVNPVAVTGTRTVPIYVSLHNPDNLLRGGMFATGQITVAEKTDAIAILASAVREDAEGHFVLKLVDGTLTRQAVEPGDPWDRGRLVEVTGLVPGDVVVAAALTELAAGETYELIED
ncbi:RND family efflux transporter, MFP subunit [Devosia sp. YR412]|uniref:efflux RND transporter periplasmic adaptor subunit n=1 Tax=Devosia sp. YR412 TaxID=1881030 RepID=UPI0008BD11A3|nr:efflux RND transporter periplasmic adaptor subunit [Devosia sp. YR412]SEP79087.1 RND family efflux transporter, MFP subunit [Devosia sp. YR412]